MGDYKLSDYKLSNYKLSDYKLSDYKHWIVMGSLMGMALASAPMSAYDNHRRDFSGETREDELDDVGLYSANQAQIRSQSQCTGPQCAQLGQCAGPECAQPVQGSASSCSSGQCGMPAQNLPCGGCGTCDDCRKKGPGPAALVDDGI